MYNINSCWVSTSILPWTLAVLLVFCIVWSVVCANCCVVKLLHSFATKRDIHIYFKSIHKGVAVITMSFVVLALALAVVFHEPTFFSLISFFVFLYWLFVCVAYIDVIHSHLTAFFSEVSNITQVVRLVCHWALIVNIELTFSVMHLIRSITLDLLEEGDSVIFVLVAILSYLVLVFIFIIVDIGLLCISIYTLAWPYDPLIVSFVIIRLLKVLVIALFILFEKKK